MDTPDQPTEESELLPPKPSGNGNGNRRVRKKRVRQVKETMYAIELHRRTMRIRMMIALGVLVFLALLAAIAAWYPGTDGFRNRLDRMILNSTGAEVVLENAEFSAFHASAERIEANWPAGNLLGRLEAENVNANVLPQRYFGRVYGGAEIRADSGRLALGYPAPDAATRFTDEAGGKARVRFDRIGIPKLDIDFGEPGSPLAALIRGTEAAFYPESVNGIPRALIYAGTLDLPFWPTFLIERGIIDFPAGATRLTSLRIRDSLPDLNNEFLVGDAEVSGEIPHDPAEAANLNLVLDGFQIEALIGEEAGRIFIGRVDTASHDQAGIMRLSREEGLQMRAELVASPRSQLTFNHFPFLAFLARAIDDRWFLNPIFEDAPTMVLIRDGSDLLVDDIRFTARNRMAIRGSLTIDLDEMIQGELEVGLAPAVIDTALARRLDGMFSPVRDDFRWVKLELGGSTRVPLDNFNALFIDAPLPEVDLPPRPAPSPDEEEEGSDAETSTADSPERPTVLPLLDLDDN